MLRLLVKLLKIIAIALPSFILLLFLLPVLFPGTVVEKVKNWTNSSIESEMNFSKVRLSFFNHFPSLTVTLYNTTLKGSAPFRNDTLIDAGEIALSVDVKSLLFSSHINIDKIFVSDALINARVNEKGEANYNVYVSKESSSRKSSNTSSAALRLEKIEISNTHLIFDDRSVGLLMNAKGFHYEGNGDLSKDIFDLYSNARIDSLNLFLDNESYLINKKVNANLITRINTNSLAFFFEKNDLMINRLPVRFSGKLDFLPNGYDIDLAVSSQNSRLEDLFTALPPQYLKWLENTKVRGRTDIEVLLKGKYITAEDKSPDISFRMNVRQGFIHHGNAPLPASGIYLSLASTMPSLNTDSLEIKIDSVFFNVGKDYVRGSLNSKGFSRPFLHAAINAEADLENIDKAFGITPVDLKGKCIVDIKTNGIYDPEKGRFPATSATVNLQNGYIKTPYYPAPISGINFLTLVSNHSGTLSDLKIKLQPFSFNFENRPFEVSASLQNFDNIEYNISAKGELNIGNIYKVFSMEGLNVNGYISTDLLLRGSQNDVANGNYQNLDNSGTLLLKNVGAHSKYFPHPFIIRNGLFRFDRDKVLFRDFEAVYSESDFRMDGYLQNLVDYVFSSSATLKGDFNVEADYVNINEFMQEQDNNSDTTSGSRGIIVIPPALDLSLQFNAGKVLFNELMLQNVSGGVSLDTGLLTLKQSKFSLIGCKILTDANYRNVGVAKALFDYAIKATDFDIRKAYDSVKIFRELATAASRAEGIVSLDYHLKGVLDANMSPVYPSLEGGGSLSVKDVKIKGMKLFSEISKKTANDSLDNPNIRKVVIRSKIKNNIITIERFRFRIFGFRPRIEGQTSFDGQLNLKMRLGLPPLGIIGIPIRVTGTQDEPKLKIGRKTEDLKETEYSP